MRKSNWIISPGFRVENKKYLKPPPSYVLIMESVLWFYPYTNPGWWEALPPGLLLGIFKPFTGNDTVRERPSPWTQSMSGDSKLKCPSFINMFFYRKKLELKTKNHVWTTGQSPLGKSRSWKFGYTLWYIGICPGDSYLWSERNIMAGQKNISKIPECQITTNIGSQRFDRSREIHKNIERTPRRPNF